VLYATPYFLLGMAFLLIFGLALRWFPTYGMLTAGAQYHSIWDRATSSLLVQFHHQASAESVEFLPGTPILLSVSADHHAVLWQLGVETRSHETVTAFARCHAPYALRETRLEPVTPSCHGE